MKKGTVILSFLLLVVSYGWAGMNTDSLMGVWNDQSKQPEERAEAMEKVLSQLKMSEPDSAYVLAKSLLAFALETKNPRAEALAYDAICYYYYASNDKDKTIEYLQKELAIEEGLGDDLLLSDTYYDLGIMYQEKNEEERSIEYLLKANGLFESLGNNDMRIMAYNNIGWNYKGLGKTDKAIEYLDNALGLLLKTGNYSRLCEVSVNLGVIYFEFAYIKEADSICDQALALKDSIPSLDKNYAKLLRLRGRIFQYQGEFSKAVIYTDSVAEFSKRMNYIREYALAFVDNGQRYYYIEEYDSALHFYEQATEIIGDDFSLLRTKAFILIQKGLLYIKRASYAKALASLQESMSICEDQKFLIEATNVYHIMGDLFVKMGEKEKAKNSYLKATGSFTINKNLRTKTLFSLGRLFYEDKELEKAQELLEKALDLGKKGNNFELIEEASRLLRNIYHEEGRYKLAYETGLIYRKAGDSVLKQKKGAELLKWSMQRDFKAEKARQEHEMEMKQQEHEANQQIGRYYIYGGILLLIILGSVGVVIYRNYKRKQRNNAIILEQKSAIEEQKETLEHIHEEMESSIRYARNIQDTLLPPEELIRELLPDSFMLYRPKDIVSGDFYFIEKEKDNVIFSVGDCTGHGVPGSFMTFIGYNGLNEAIHDHELIQPAAILDKLNAFVKDTLHQSDENEDGSKDGMDISLCHYDPQSKMLMFSGANNPLWLVRKGELIELSADYQPIGLFIASARTPFTNHEIQLEKGDCIYLFSDGYQDQFGGPKGKKFMKGKFKKLLISIAEKPMQEQHDILDSTIKDWMAQTEQEQIDDICLMGVRV